MIFANTMFQAVCYLPDECQLITGGTDRKVGYWEVYDGSQIRELEGSKTGSINGIDISSCGCYFVTGGDDRVVKVPQCPASGRDHAPTSGKCTPLSRELCWSVLACRFGYTTRAKSLTQVLVTVATSPDYGSPQMVSMS